MPRPRTHMEPGDRFGKWTVVRELEPKAYPSGVKLRQVLVRCDCGREVVREPAKVARRRYDGCRDCHHTSMSRQPGEQVGDWEVIEQVGRTKSRPVYRCRCVRCHREANRTSPQMRQCECRKPAPAPAPKPKPKPKQPPRRREEPRYHEDPRAQRIVSEYPDGAPLDVVGDVMGLSRERVRQIEERALRTLATRCHLAGIRAEDIHAYFADKQPTTWERIELLDTGA